MNLAVSLVGAGGLLGSAVLRRVQKAGHDLVTFSELPWTDPEATVRVIADLHQDLMRNGWMDGKKWVVMWCAGGGGVGARSQEMKTETNLVRGLASWVRATVDRWCLPTVFSFASSGGAIWSGTNERVLSEETAPIPWHPYGEAKLLQERSVDEAMNGSKYLRARLARISNLYGPPPPGRQPSGLVGHLVANSLKGIPTGIYVPMDTQRDYIHVDDAANTMLTDAVSALSGDSHTNVDPGTSAVDLVASGRSHTIASTVAILQRVLTRSVPLTVGFSPLASRQPRVLSFRSSKRDLQVLSPVSLQVGMRRLVDALLAR